MSKVIHLIKFGLETPIYITDCDRDYVYGGHTYKVGYVKINQPLRQKSEPSANDFSLTLSAVDQTMVSAFASNSYKGKQCLVTRVELNVDETVNATSVWLDGELNKYVYIGKTTESTMKISVGSVFAAFESTNMVNLLDKFSDSINNDETKYWGKEGGSTDTWQGGVPDSDRPPA